MKLILKVSFLFLSNICVGQVTVLNHILTIPDSNVIYIGETNVIEIQSKYPANLIRLKSEKLKIRYDENKNRYFVTTYASGGIDTLSIFYNGLIVKKEVFYLERLCDPKIVFGTDNSIQLSTNQILSNPVLNVFFACLYNKKAYVNRFNCLIINAVGDTITYEKVEGNKLNASQLKLIKPLKPGSMIIFERIIAWGSFCPRTFSPVIITVR